MKVSHINTHDIRGGAARAAYRIHTSLLDENVQSCMKVSYKHSDDPTVDWQKLKIPRNIFAHNFEKLVKSGLPKDMGKQVSSGLFSSGIIKNINNSDSDIIHLHWVLGNMLSIRDIGSITKPVVWTIHDMWPFCGAEFYTSDENEARFVAGYNNKNRDPDEVGWDLSRYVWKRKINSWSRPMTIVSPSHWLADCAERSVLFKNNRIEVIPNPLDVTKWRPSDKNAAREFLGLQEKDRIILFGAIGGTTDRRKGADILADAMKFLKTYKIENIQILIFGQSKPSTTIDLGFPVHYLGHLHDDISLSLVYTAADVMVVPSRQEAFGQTASEAHACGIPVVAFRVGGLIDIIDHKHTGYLATPFDAEDLARGIAWILEDKSRRDKLGIQARKKVVESFSAPIIAREYHKLYKSILEK